jgi:U3 small nucleolar RNA-associated protein 14
VKKYHIASTFSLLVWITASVSSSTTSRKYNARGEKLRRRIKGVGSDGESGSDEGDDDDDGDGAGEGGVDKLKQAAFDELQKINLEDSSTSANEQRAGKTIFDMKFMKDATARQQSADRMADDFIKEIGVAGDGEQDSDMDEAVPQGTDTASGVVAVRTGGRVVYRPGAVVCLSPVIYQISLVDLTVF